MGFANSDQQKKKLIEQQRVAKTNKKMEIEKPPVASQLLFS